MARRLLPDADPFRNPCDPPLRILDPDGAPIETLEQWKRRTGPAGGARQWVKGRSAYESAHAWVGRRGPAAPEELEELLDEHPDTRGFRFGLVRPEVRVPLDEFRGNTRNTDVLAFGRAREVPTAVSIEAKVDEPFGPRLLQAIRANPGSRRPERVDRLCQLILNRSLEEVVKTSPKLRYQLLHALGATVNAAELTGLRQAIFVIHEFRTPRGSAHRYSTNARDWRAFLSELELDDLDDQELAELGWRPAGVRCLIGKVVHRAACVRSRGEATTH